jgi:hypothetical protein
MQNKKQYKNKKKNTIIKINNKNKITTTRTTTK